MSTLKSGEEIKAAIFAGSGKFTQDDINGMSEALKFVQQQLGKELTSKYKKGDWVLFPDPNGVTIKGFVDKIHQKSVTVIHIDAAGSPIKYVVPTNLLTKTTASTKWTGKMVSPGIKEEQQQGGTNKRQRVEYVNGNVVLKEEYEKFEDDDDNEAGMDR